MQLVAAVRDIGYFDMTGGMRNGEIGCVDGNHHGAHLRVDVAEQKADPNAIKVGGVGGAGFVETEVETLAVEKRKNIVEEGITIREIDDGACAHHEKMGLKALVFLNQLGTFVSGLVRGQRSNTGIERLQPENDLAGIGSA